MTFNTQSSFTLLPSVSPVDTLVPEFAHFYGGGSLKTANQKDIIADMHKKTKLDLFTVAAKKGKAPLKTLPQLPSPLIIHEKKATEPKTKSKSQHNKSTASLPKEESLSDYTQTATGLFVKRSSGKKPKITCRVVLKAVYVYAVRVKRGIDHKGDLDLEARLEERDG